MKRTARADWQGRLRDGQGRLTTGSGVLTAAKYSFSTRFEGEPGTNPEELMAAAHAGCFSMALGFFLEQGGFLPESIATEAELSLENDGAGWQVAGIHLSVAASVPGIGASRFQELAERAKAECLISRLLKTDVTLDARLIE